VDAPDGAVLADVAALVDRIRAARAAVPSAQSVLVGVTGIDGSGKGYLSSRIVTSLAGHGLRAAGINVDGWLNLPHVRFGTIDAAEHFYRHAIRFDELFDDLVLPLRDRRSVAVNVNHAEETATAFQRKRYVFHDVDVVVLEGIYLLKRAFASLYDVSCWIDCTFDTALARALARGQEGLSREATIAAYRTIYFPAQEIHIARDAPREAATVVVVNDPKLG
jgi:uridine kinase